MNGIKYRSADEMKDSGIEWLGEIPREWQSKRLKEPLIKAGISGSTP